MTEAEYLAVLVRQNNAVISLLFFLPLVMCVCLVIMDMFRS
mgnify:CR=1 FL=1